MKGIAWRFTVSGVLALALLLTGCDLLPQGGQEVDVSPTPTLEIIEPTPAPVDPTPTPTVPEPPEEEELAYVGVEVPEAGLSLEVPGDWVRLEPEWGWAPELGSDLRVGVAWMTLEPPQEPEAVMLPAPSEVVSSDPVELAFGAGRRVVLNVFASAAEGDDDQASVAAVEAHVLVTVIQGGVRQAYDIFASAPDLEALETLEPVLQHMMETAMVENVQDDVAETVRGEVAEELGVTLEEITLGELVPMAWPDACLGLPGEDEMCAMVITPGYGVTVTVDGQPYEVRLNEEGTQVRLNSETVELPEVPDTSALPEAVRGALGLLARHLSLPESSVSVVSYEYVEWPTACLGIQKPGQMCATVITPGYRVVLSAGGLSFQVHTNQSGTSIGIIP